MRGEGTLLLVGISVAYLLMYIAGIGLLAIVANQAMGLPVAIALFFLVLVINYTGRKRIPDRGIDA
ncbi:MAG: hypothetical protein HGB34_03030 [Candidatus Moranbacteria bacterium]|nr:hypothetical protein [Candidatus Moranbacteria bacterium]